MKIDPPSKDKLRQSHCPDNECYERLYRQSIEDPETFWATQAEELEWFDRWERAVNSDFGRVGKEPYARYFEGATLNVSHNCLDRHVNKGLGEKPAIIWLGEKEGERRVLTFQELLQATSRTAHLLRQLGVKKGQTVTLFMPMIPELVIAMLACARIGAIHSVVFSAFSAKALHDRLLDCCSPLLITADVSFHNGKAISLKEKVDQALVGIESVEKVLVLQRQVGDLKEEKKKIDWQASLPCEGVEAVPVGAEDPLFILYTSGSTGKPKAVLHTTAGYHLYTHLTFKYIFDYKPEDIYWCTADLGWITGHSYVIYGPLSNGATVVMYEGAPFFPTPDRFWQIIAQEKVSIFYTAPTAIRSFMRLGEEWPKAHSLKSLRLLGSVGEPINPEAWRWYYRVIGEERCPIVDTWWQTETGGILLTTLPAAHAMKPGAAGKPFFGIVPHVEEGALFIRQPWPGMLRGLYKDKDHAVTKATYFPHSNGFYCSQDGCVVDEEGYHWLQGRVDDVLNVSGHRLSTAEIESALVSHPAVAEAAVVGIPHETKGQGICCFVTLKEGYHESLALQEELVQYVRRQISPIATPHQIHFTKQLPKTRSGKIMRRLLRKIMNQEEDLGDLSTLADPDAIEALRKLRCVLDVKERID